MKSHSKQKKKKFDTLHYKLYQERAVDPHQFHKHGYRRRTIAFAIASLYTIGSLYASKHGLFVVYDLHAGEFLGKVGEFLGVITMEHAFKIPPEEL